jgi:hypothetical protein
MTPVEVGAFVTAESRKFAGIIEKARSNLELA